jgi:hypothetical protein
MSRLIVVNDTAPRVEVVERGAQGPQGSQGPQGPQGIQGPTGSAATVAVGTVTTGAAGSSVSVTNRGTTAAAVLDITIPQGVQGVPGATFNGGTITTPLTVSATAPNQLVLNRADNGVDAKRVQVNVSATTGNFTFTHTSDAAAALAVGTAADFSRSEKRATLYGISYFSGTGNPNGVVTANVGSRYVDTNATNGAVEWVKASGAGNTGWKVTYGDTGWRTPVLLNGWASTTPRIRRINETVHIAFNTLSGATSTTDSICDLLQGFRSGGYPINPRITIYTGTGSIDTTHVIVADAGSNTLRCVTSGSNTTFSGHTVGSWVTDDDWPALIP